MPLGSESLGVVIAGAASLLGKDLKQWLVESGFPACETRLLDEEFAAGTLTDLGDEPAVIQPVDESSFEGARFVFFTGSPEFALKHGPAAVRAGATVIDLTGGLVPAAGAPPWIPRLDNLLSEPQPRSAERSQVFVSPSAPAIVACSLALALNKFAPRRLAIVFLQSVSERGRPGVEELEAQTGKLLSLQPLPKQIFDAQVAFNLLDRWGEESAARLADTRAALSRQVGAYLEGQAPAPAMTLIQAPVFFGVAFSAYVEFSSVQNPDVLAEQLQAAGFAVSGEGDPAPSIAAAPGENRPLIGRAERDCNGGFGYWLWGAADNLRVATANAILIAESVLAA